MLERLSVGEGSFVRTMADSAGFGNLVAQVPRMLLELTNRVSVISTSGSLLPPEEYAKLECALPARATLPRRTPQPLTPPPSPIYRNPPIYMSLVLHAHQYRA